MLTETHTYILSKLFMLLACGYKPILDVDPEFGDTRFTFKTFEGDYAISVCKGFRGFFLYDPNDVLYIDPVTEHNEEMITNLALFLTSIRENTRI